MIANERPNMRNKSVKQKKRKKLLRKRIGNKRKKLERRYYAIKQKKKRKLLRKMIGNKRPNRNKLRKKYQRNTE